MAKEIKATAFKEAARKFARAATVSDVIRAVFVSKTSPAFNDRAAALAALEDGAALAALGFTDEDTAAIEGAYHAIKSEQCGLVTAGILELRATMPAVCIDAAEYLADSVENDRALDSLWSEFAYRRVTCGFVDIEEWFAATEEADKYCNELMRNHSGLLLSGDYSIYEHISMAWQEWAIDKIEERRRDVYTLAAAILFKPLEYLSIDEMPDSLEAEMYATETAGEFRALLAQHVARIEAERRNDNE